MKYLIALSLFQAVLLGFFGVRVLSIDARTHEIAATRPTAATLADIVRAEVNPYRADPVVVSGPTAEDIRAIVREEIGVVAARVSAPPTEETVKNESNSRPDTDSLKTSINQDLDRYIGRGEIGAAEMNDLQRKLARLPAEEQSEIFSRIAKAMSDGSLDGQF